MHAGACSRWPKYARPPARACVNVLDHGETGWIVRTVNYIPYDPLHPARTTTMEHLWSELKTWLDERA